MDLRYISFYYFSIFLLPLTYLSWLHVPFLRHLSCPVSRALSLLRWTQGIFFYIIFLYSYCLSPTSRSREISAMKRRQEPMSALALLSNQAVFTQATHGMYPPIHPGLYNQFYGTPELYLADFTVANKRNREHSNNESLISLLQHIQRKGDSMPVDIFPPSSNCFNSRPPAASLLRIDTSALNSTMLSTMSQWFEGYPASFR